MRTPLKLLKLELAKWESAKQKSIQSYNAGIIDSLLHESHLRNLNPLIKEYKKAVEILTKHL